MSSRRRYEHMKKVWLSCETDTQRRNAERWINRVAKRYPYFEHRDIWDFIGEWNLAFCDD